MEPSNDNLQPSEQKLASQKEISLFAKILFLFVVVSIPIIIGIGMNERIYPFSSSIGDWSGAAGYALMFFLSIPGFLLGASPLSLRWKTFGTLGLLLSNITSLFIYSRIDFFSSFGIGFALGIFAHIFVKKIEVRLLFSKPIRIFFLILLCVIAIFETVLIIYVINSIIVSRVEFTQNTKSCRQKNEISCYQKLGRKYWFFSEKTCNKEKGIYKDYCYDALALDGTGDAGLYLCKNSTKGLSSCTMQLMALRKAHSFNQTLGPSFGSYASYSADPPRCEMFFNDKRLIGDCYSSYAYYLPATTKKEIDYRVSICEKIENEPEAKQDCFLETAKKSTPVLIEKDVLQEKPAQATEEKLVLVDTNVQGHTTKSCVDSDGGRNLFTKGSVKGVERCTKGIDSSNMTVGDCSTGETVKEDLCVQNKYNHNMNGKQAGIIEYYCGSDGRITAQGDLCLNGCYDGACKK